jgi:hypothetical protein
MLSKLNKKNINKYRKNNDNDNFIRLYGSCYEVLDAGQTYDALIGILCF